MGRNAKIKADRRYERHLSSRSQQRYGHAPDDVASVPMHQHSLNFLKGLKSKTPLSDEEVLARYGEEDLNELLLESLGYFYINIRVPTLWDVHPELGKLMFMLEAMGGEHTRNFCLAGGSAMEMKLDVLIEHDLFPEIHKQIVAWLFSPPIQDLIKNTRWHIDEFRDPGAFLCPFLHSELMLAGDRLSIDTPGSKEHFSKQVYASYLTLMMETIKAASNIAAGRLLHDAGDLVLHYIDASTIEDSELCLSRRLKDGTLTFQRVVGLPPVRLSAIKSMRAFIRRYKGPRLAGKFTDHPMSERLCNLVGIKTVGNHGVIG